MVLICISLKISDVEHIFIWLLAIGMSLLEKCLFSASIDFFFFNCFDCPAKHGLSSFPNQWSNPCSLQWNVEVLITGPPGKPSLTIFLIKNFILYWSIADEQCCDSFRWTAKGLSHTISFFFFFKLLSSMSSLQILDTNLVSDIWGFPGGAGGILATSKNVPVFLPGESHGQRHLVGYSL